MLLGFKKQFEPMVKDGSKAHSIRAERKNSPKVGEICHCYGDVRQKSMHLLGRWVCVKVESIRIRRNVACQWGVWIAGQRLSQDEMDLLAWRDGFRHPWHGDPREGLGYGGCFKLMAEFWVQNHGKRRHHYMPKEVDFQGVMIHWDYRQPVSIAHNRRKRVQAA